MIDLDLSDVKPSVFNWILIGLMAVTFIVVAKYAVNQFANPVTDFIRPLINTV